MSDFTEQLNVQLAHEFGASMADLLRTVERAAETNILLAEDYLSRTAIDQGHRPDAPPAAGGAL